MARVSSILDYGYGRNTWKQGRSQVEGLGGLRQRDIVFRGAKHCYLNARQDDEAWRLHGQPASRGGWSPPAPLLAPPLVEPTVKGGVGFLTLGERETQEIVEPFEI